MTEQSIRFAEGFPMPTYEQWVAEVEKALKGAPFDKKMLTKTYEGVTLRPIYTRQDWPSEGDPSGLPGAMPFTRGSRAAGNRVSNWDVRQSYAYPDTGKCNDVILNDLARGISSLRLCLDEVALSGMDVSEPKADLKAGVGGIMVYGLSDLDRLLTGVYLDLIAVSLETGAQFLPAASLLAALWQKRRIAPTAARGAFNADPLGTLASRGSLPYSVEEGLALLADLAKHTSATYPLVTAVGVDTSPYHDAGATESQDLAASMATAVAYLRAMTAAGLSVDAACQQILFTYSVPCDQFLGICKLRAARKLWSRIAESCGASEPARGMKIDAITAWRMMSERDPWVNMLRTTVACFAAAVSGADSITVRPFDAAIGLSGELGRRVARNTHVILAEESNLSKVVDPAGGSWYVESRTDELAKLAWAEFQAIEKAGGMAAVLADGSFAKKIAETYSKREANLAKRRDPLTGVSEFPNVTELPVEPEEVDLLASYRAACDRAKAHDAAAVSKPLQAVASAKPQATQAAVAAAAAGATIGELATALKGSETTIPALPRHRLTEPFEALRSAADAFQKKTGARPQIFLANLGPIAKHTGRATFAKNFFEVAGIEAIPNSGFADPATCAEAFKASGARIAILCSADPVYEELAVPTAQALKAAGCEYLFLAGAPGDKKDTYTAGGIDDFIFLGGDVLATTRSILARLGVI